ncbi:DUF4031 domain-containing protein [Nocardiopsis ansamitocini]|uniref:DUF4031 domain-containing protein n=1 Tax=Nocardiopsis ansamitocini TaxID=1670832 RepID=A0A9W6UHQ2_9ACTN|nr:DUF4031 domain-containing protein [Nocardiopsis ansamitocini]GLU46235.1 hypothetical protein Nans01_05860 [Nocardiopsis ansamitocini]
MSVFIDPPAWPGPRGLLWSHLISDASYAELHAFARALGVSERAFERDHYDVPETLYSRALHLGAAPVPARTIVARLHAAGLRRRKNAQPRVAIPGPDGN